MDLFDNRVSENQTNNYRVQRREKEEEGKLFDRVG